MTKRCTILTLVVVVGVILPAVGSAGLEDEIELLRREVYNLRREIADVKDRLRQVLAIRFAVAGRHELVIGSPDEQHRTFDPVQPRR